MSRVDSLSNPLPLTIVADVFISWPSFSPVHCFFRRRRLCGKLFSNLVLLICSKSGNHSCDQADPALHACAYVLVTPRRNGTKLQLRDALPPSLAPSANHIILRRIAPLEVNVMVRRYIIFRLSSFSIYLRGVVWRGRNSWT